jgi:NAD(P)-dependent dehydrogenase (short-subunit alcohol dehydrogenase family)
MTLSGKRALVTGASRGIGAAIAKALAAEGADVAITYENSAERAEEVVRAIKAQGRRAVAIRADSADVAAVQASVEKTVAELGGLDILVNNAGVADHGGIEDVSLEEWNATIGIDQTGVFLGMKTAAKALTASEHGSVVNISSIYGTIGGFGHSPAYHAAKGAVRTLTKNVALHWADRGIRVNSVHPGFIDTPIIAGVRGTPAEQAILGMTPLGRLGKASEIAAGVAYLASDDASYVTGLELYIDGGWIAR